MIIREERAEDRAGVYEVEALAFGRNAEADLVEELRKHGKVTLSLVSEEEGQMIGHVMFTPGWIEGPSGRTAVEGMAPVAVRPGWQGKGIGSELVRTGLERMRLAGRHLIMVVGNPRYYMRFGFLDAAPFGITCEFNPPPGCFMIQALAERALEGVSGTAHYAEEFKAVG